MLIFFRVKPCRSGSGAWRLEDAGFKVVKTGGPNRDTYWPQEDRRYQGRRSGSVLQTDPIGSKDDLDLYSYVGDDPIDRGDPTGNSGLTLSGEYWYAGIMPDYTDNHRYDSAGVAIGFNDGKLEIASYDSHAKDLAAIMHEVMRLGPTFQDFGLGSHRFLDFRVCQRVRQ